MSKEEKEKITLIDFLRQELTVKVYGLGLIFVSGVILGVLFN